MGPAAAHKDALIYLKFPTDWRRGGLVVTMHLSSNQHLLFSFLFMNPSSHKEKELQIIYLLPI